MDAPADKSPLKVLIVLTSNSRRGAEIAGSELAHRLADLGIDSHAVSLAPGAETKVLDLPVLGSRPLAPSTLRALRRRARGIDVVIAYGSSTLPACALALLGTRVPFIYRSIGEPGAWLRGSMHRWRTGLLLRRAARVVTLWPGAATSIEELFSISPERLAVISNGCSSDEFRMPTPDERAAARRRFGVPHDVRVVGCVGSIAPEKRVRLAVDTVAELNDVHLLVVGDGPDRSDVESHAALVLGERSTFTGVIDDVVHAYWAMDALLLTSRTEGMPGVVIEAAMSGVPVVSTDVGAASWMFEQGIRGSLVSAESPPESTARVLSDVLDAPSPRPDAVSFAWAPVVAQWRSICEETSSR